MREGRNGGFKIADARRADVVARRGFVCVRLPRLRLIADGIGGGGGGGDASGGAVLSSATDGIGVPGLTCSFVTVRLTYPNAYTVTAAVVLPETVSETRRKISILPGTASAPCGTMIHASLSS